MKDNLEENIKILTIFTGICQQQVPVFRFINMKLPNDFKIGITLSGGASYGIAHIGVLKALREYGIEPSTIYGTSAGSIVAVLYASGASIRDLKKFARESKISKMVRWKIPRLGFIPMDSLEHRLKLALPFENLEELPISTYIGVTNLESGQHESLAKGSIAKAVTASCAIPVFFKPVEFGDQWYVDGGVANNMPAEILKESCDFVIGSNVVESVCIDRSQCNSFKKIMERTLTISLITRTYVNYGLCDYVVEPKGLAQFAKFDFSKVDEMIELGYKITIEDLPAILDKIHQKLAKKYREHKSNGAWKGPIVLTSSSVSA